MPRTGKISAIVVLSLLALTAAADQSRAAIQAGNYVYFFDGAGNTGGGEFGVQRDTGGGRNASLVEQMTFCVQTNEFLNFSNKFYVESVTDYVTYQPNTSGGSGGIDPISPKTAYLYTQFSKGTLSNYDYGNASLRVLDANSLQRAIWFLEDELTSQSLLNSYFGDQQAKDWVDEATAAGWTSIGNVRVMNLRWDGPTGNRAQDQLFMGPEQEVVVAEPASIAVWSLLGATAFGFVRLRRRHNQA